MHAQIKTLTLMAAVLAAIVVLCCYPERGNAGQLYTKEDHLFQYLPSCSTSKKHPKSGRKIHRNQTILFIGDSMVEGLSRRLGDYSAENGHTLYTVIWYSSSTERWGNDPYSGVLHAQIQTNLRNHLSRKQ